MLQLGWDTTVLIYGTLHNNPSNITSIARQIMSRGRQFVRATMVITITFLQPDRHKIHHCCLLCCIFARTSANDVEFQPPPHAPLNSTAIIGQLHSHYGLWYLILWLSSKLQRQATSNKCARRGIFSMLIIRGYSSSDTCLPSTISGSGFGFASSPALLCCIANAIYAALCIKRDLNHINCNPKCIQQHIIATTED